VTAEAHREPVRRADDDGEPGDDAGRRPPRPSRFGRAFGDAVHRAIGLALADPGLAPGDAVARAAEAAGLLDRRAEAAADVARALAALAAAGLRRAPGDDLRLEYPVARASSEGAALVQGYVDLLGRRAGRAGLAVIDFKTDAPPGPGEDVVATHPAYVEQVRAYARLVAALGLAADVEAGLLFTADGGIRWVG
jgi:ATP-dependent helicase/nuclease subunit A